MTAGPWAHSGKAAPANGFEPVPLIAGGPERGGQRWPFVLGALVIALVVLGLVGSGLAADDADEGPPGPTTSAVSSPLPTVPASSASTTLATSTLAPTTSAVEPRGTQDAPLAMGETFTLQDADNGDLDITVNGFIADGGPAIAAANRFNVGPPAGYQYMLVNVTVTYHAGAERQSVHGVGLAASLSAFGASAVELDDFSCSAVLPDPLDSFAELLDGGTVTGNECILAPTGDAAGPLLLRARESLCIANCDEVWVRLQ